MKDLDRRLDLDLDELLNSPKLKMKLSPAELDKQCLELYELMSEGPGGDLLRILGGGNDVALQHRYMKRKAMNELKAARSQNATAPFYVNSFNTDERSRTTSQWVQWTMRKNLPSNGTFAFPPNPVPDDDTNTEERTTTQKNEETSLRMFNVNNHGPTLASRRLVESRRAWGAVSVLPSHSHWMTYSRNLASKRSARGLSLLI